MGGGVISASMVISDEIEGLQMLPLIVLDRFSSAAWNTEGAVGWWGVGGVSFLHPLYSTVGSLGGRLGLICELGGWGGGGEVGGGRRRMN